MALLKPQFLREHPVRSGMIWAVGWVVLFLALAWLTGIIPVNVRLIGVVVLTGIIGGLTWGYAMKAYHDREASR